MRSNTEIINRAWKAAIDYFKKNGWSTRDVDREIADRIYARWLRETDEVWRESGYRDRVPLHVALEETFEQRYGEDGGSARVIIFSLLLACHALSEGHVRQGRPEA